MGMLIGVVSGLIILGIMTLVRQSKAKAQAAGVQAALVAGGAGGRAALDRRIPAQAGLRLDPDVEQQRERLAALAQLGELDAIAREIEAFDGTPIHIATARTVGFVALAAAGRDPAAQLAGFEADHAALVAAGVNKLSLRAVASVRPLLRALAGQGSVSDAERAEVLLWAGSPVVKQLYETALGGR